jgi:hypothetical protein
LTLTGAAVLTSATLSGFETIELATNTVTLNDTQINGTQLTITGTTAATTDDIVAIADIDGGTTDLSGLALADVDVITFNATGSAYTTATGTTNNIGAGITVAAGLDATALGSGVAFTFTGSTTDDVVVTGGGGDTITTLAGDDEIASGAGNDYIISGDGADFILAQGGNDTIEAGDGADIVNGGTGQNTIYLGASDGDADIVDMDTLDNDDYTIINNYVQGTDTIAIDVTLATGGTFDATNGVVTGEYQTAVAATAYTVGKNEGMVEFNFAFDTDRDLDNSGAGASLTNILSAIGAANDSTASTTALTAGTLAVTTAADEFIGIFYQGGNAYLYRFTEVGGNTGITVADNDTAELVAKIVGVSVGALGFADFA